MAGECCKSCGRLLLVGEHYRMFRRWFGRTSPVCAECDAAAVIRGWEPTGEALVCTSGEHVRVLASDDSELAAGIR